MERVPFGARCSDFRGRSQGRPANLISLSCASGVEGTTTSSKRLIGFEPHRSTRCLAAKRLWYTAGPISQVCTARILRLKHSRLYHFTASGIDHNVTLDAAPVGANRDETHENLGGLFRSVFHTHARRQFGHFDGAAENALLFRCLSDYREQKTDAETLGQQLAERFKECLAAIEQALNWYLWFFVESGGEGEIVYLFLFECEQSHHISPAMRVEIAHGIDPARLQYAIKIDMAEWLAEQSQTYLSYLCPRNQHPVTAAWRTFIGFAEGIDRAAQTEQFLGVIERYADALPAEQEHEYRTKVVDFCLDRDRAGEPVEIEELSRHLDEAAPDALLRFMTERAEEPVRTLYPDRRQLKRYMRFYGRDQDLSISFSTATLGRHVVYDESTGTLIIREIPKALKSQLSQHSRRSE